MANEHQLNNASYIKGSYFPVTAANNAISSEDVVLHGIIVNSHTSGVFRIHNGTTGTAQAIGGSFTLAAGSQIITYPRPIELANGLFIGTSGTVDATAIVS